MKTQKEIIEEKARNFKENELMLCGIADYLSNIRKSCGILSVNFDYESNRNFILMHSEVFKERFAGEYSLAKRNSDIFPYEIFVIKNGVKFLALTDLAEEESNEN